MNKNNQTVFLSTAYLPNIQYITKILLHSDYLIEVNDTYQKQSFRNRCTITGANGKQDLSIPVIKPNGNKSLTKDILIDNDVKWQQDHWRAIVSAYGHSPFFEILEPELIHLYKIREKYLVDFNKKVLGQLFSCTGYNVNITFTTTYLKNLPDNLDFRDRIHPKKRMHREDPNFEAFPYFQVFLDKHGFIPNLSFIDLLFNEGPQALDICKKSTVDLQR